MYYDRNKLHHPSLGARTEDKLMRFIINEPIEIGQKIPNEFELAKKFGVGRSTIREAVKGLVSRGILDIRRGSGTYVISTFASENDPLGFSQIPDKYTLALDLFNVRLMIEPEIAALAGQNASEAQLKELATLCQETERLYKSGSNHIRKDIEFHTCIARCSGNQVAERLIPVISTAVLTFANATHRILMEETLSSHQAILDAIVKRDPTGAKCAMIMHLTYNRQTILRLLEDREHNV